MPCRRTLLKRLDLPETLNQRILADLANFDEKTRNRLKSLYRVIPANLQLSAVQRQIQGALGLEKNRDD